MEFNKRNIYNIFSWETAIAWYKKNVLYSNERFFVLQFYENHKYGGFNKEYHLKWGKKLVH